MADPTDEKIELLVRSVLAAVDARLDEVRSEIQAVKADVEQRHRDVLSQLHALEVLWEARVAEPGPVASTSTTPVPAPLAPLPTSMDMMSSPLHTGPPSGQVPVAASLPTAITLPPIPPLTSAPPREPSGEPAGPIDISRLADLLSEQLGSLTLPAQQQT